MCVCVCVCVCVSDNRSIFCVEYGPRCVCVCFFEVVLEWIYFAKGVCCVWGLAEVMQTALKVCVCVFLLSYPSFFYGALAHTSASSLPSLSNFASILSIWFKT